MNTSDIKKFVYPILENNAVCCGVGVFVQDYFITAGHVVRNNNCHIYIDGKKCPLLQDEAVGIQTINNNGEESTQEDFAIFRFPGVNSPLTLAKYMPKENEELTCIYFEHDPSLLDKQSFDLIQMECNGTVSRIIHNFFECKMNEILLPGSSGSPILRDTEVIGVLSGNLQPDKKEYLLFQSAKSINKD